MELFLEILVEGIFGAVFETTIKKPKVKKWFKTAVFLLLFESLPATLAIIMAVDMCRSGIESGTMVGFIICTLLAMGILALGIYGHIKNWHQKEKV